MLISHRCVKREASRGAANATPAAGTANNQAVDRQQDDRPDDRGDEAAPLPLSVPAQGTSDKTRQNGSPDAEQHRDDHAPGIPPWHEQLSDCAGYQTDYDHPD